MRRWRPRRPRLPRTRTGQRRLIRAVVAGCVLGLLPATWLHLVTGDRLRTTADVPRTEVAVVFGAGLWRSEPSPYLAHRLDAAAELYRAGRIEVVLVTGDNSREEYDEPDAMRAYLVRHGVPRRADRQRLRRFRHLGLLRPREEGLRRGPGGPDQPGLPHPARGGAVPGGGGGLDGVGADDVHDVTWYYGGTREILAAGKAALDAVFEPDPTFLGPKEPGVARALDLAGER